MVDFPNQVGPMCDWPYIEVLSGAKVSLAELSKKSSCHVATNARDSNEVQIRQALQRAELNAYFNNVFCFANVGVAKDDASYFQRIISTLGTHAGDVTMIGDSLQNDIFPALNAGLNAIWFNPHQRIVPLNIRSISQLGDLIT